MDSDLLISAKNVGLVVPVFKPSERKFGTNPIRLVSDFYSNKSTRQVKPLLSDIFFDLRKGERLGIIGKNGAGKTTLLRTICGVYRPTSGHLEINGESQGVFNVQLGMNPQATGLENIYLRGLQMGLKLGDIKSRIPDVVEFADIGDAMNDIFANYSTGMRLRLSMAISTMVKPEILVMDEWIGSGDADFRQKINDRMNMLIEGSSGLVIATHSSPLMRKLCSKGLVLSEGESKFYGTVDDALKYYQTQIVKTPES